MKKETTCVVWGATVSKRKSLAFEHEGKTGRACRDHPEVIAYVANTIKVEDMRNIKEKMSLISAVGMVKMLHSLRGTPVSVLLYQIRAKKGKEFYLKCRNEIDKTGAALSAKDLMISMLAYTSSAFTLTRRQCGYNKASR